MWNIVSDINISDQWSGVIEARNTASHQVTGDDVISALLHCEDNLHHVLEGHSGHSGEYPQTAGPILHLNRGASSFAIVHPVSYFNIP